MAKISSNGGRNAIIFTELLDNIVRFSMATIGD
jgi:hypothetical protein